MKKKKRRLKLWVWKGLYITFIFILLLAVIWPKSDIESQAVNDTNEEIVDVEENNEEAFVENVESENDAKDENYTPKQLSSTSTYNANRMTHYVMDGIDAGTCIAGRWCINKQLKVDDDTDILYTENGIDYNVWAVHCSVVKEWRGSIIRVHYTDGGVEDGIVLDCGSFGGHKDRMDKAMGTRYNGKQDNYTLSRYIKTAEVLRKGW